LSLGEPCDALQRQLLSIPTRVNCTRVAIRTVLRRKVARAPRRSEVRPNRRYRPRRHHRAHSGGDCVAFVGGPVGPEHSRDGEHCDLELAYLRQKEHPMIRLTVVAVMFAIGAASLATPQANAQSPDPALLAPGNSGRMLAPPRYTGSPSSYGSAGHHGVYRSRHGTRLSHPSTHNH
jgi:hypothetical protein